MPQTPSLAAPGRAAVPASLAAVALALLVGCADAPTRPAASGAGLPRLVALWPNADGREWNYTASKRSLASGFLALTPIDEPLAPVTLADVRRLVREAIPDGDAGAETYPYRMRFAGTLVTRSGVRAQNLEESFPFPPPGAAGADAAFARHWGARLALARPDLRAALAARGLAPAAGPAGALARGEAPRPAAAARDPWPPELIHGYAWLTGPLGVGAYGDNDTLLAWKFLDRDVRVGRTFRFALLPTVAHDLWLWGSVEREHAVDVPGLGRVSDALEVLYLIDYGDAVLTDWDGRPIGHYRGYDYGTVTYAPGLGPVRVFERRFAVTGLPDARGLWELEFVLDAAR